MSQRDPNLVSILLCSVNATYSLSSCLKASFFFFQKLFLVVVQIFDLRFFWPNFIEHKWLTINITLLYWHLYLTIDNNLLYWHVCLVLIIICYICMYYWYYFAIFATIFVYSYYFAIFAYIFGYEYYFAKLPHIYKHWYCFAVFCI